jgi:subtilisin family serine protease
VTGLRPAVAAEAEGDYAYPDKPAGRERRFRPRDDEVVATYQPGAGRRFAVVRVAGGGAGEAARALSAQEPVANAIPAMIDDEGRTRYFLPDEVTVRFRPGVGREAAEGHIARLGARVLREQRTPGYYTLQVPEGRGLFATIRDLAALDDVLFAEPSEPSFDDAFASPPQDPGFPLQWALQNTGQRVRALRGTPGCDVRALEAWAVTRGDPEVVVAVIDTGADLAHPDLAPNLVPRGEEDWDFADSGDPSPADEHVTSHGTHVAGTAAAAGNAIGVSGVAPACRIMPLRIDLGTGMSQNRADAINYVAAHAGAHPERRYVLNCSWGTSGDHAGVRDAIGAAVAANALVVFAAGNSGADIDVIRQYPALYPDVVAVAATDRNDRKTWFSNYGPSVDVAAPGANIYATIRGGYGYQEGTSMAAPHVAGVAALAWSANRALTNAQVRAVVEGSCDDIAAANPGLDGLLGRGRVNALRAVTAAVEAAPALSAR